MDKTLVFRACKTVSETWTCHAKLSLVRDELAIITYVQNNLYFNSFKLIQYVCFFTIILEHRRLKLCTANKLYQDNNYIITNSASIFLVLFLSFTSVFFDKTWFEYFKYHIFIHIYNFIFRSEQWGDDNMGHRNFCIIYRVAWTSDSKVMLLATFQQVVFYYKSKKKRWNVINFVIEKEWIKFSK